MGAFRFGESVVLLDAVPERAILRAMIRVANHSSVSRTMAGRRCLAAYSLAALAVAAANDCNTARGQTVR